MASDTEAPDTNKELLEAFERATIGFNLCPNRVWAVAKEKLPKLMPDSESISGHEKHEICNFDFCEYSQRDFTGVEQRHECKEKKCGRLQYLFSRDTLEEATTSTVWGLDGKSMIDPPRPYMAISHVWSDGTGAGLGQMEKSTNACTPFSGRSQDNLNARESGGILFVFPKERQHETGLFGISQAIMRTPESLWSMTASSDPGSGTREWHALPFSCHPGLVEAGPPWSWQGRAR
jgi:hypothetical protein